MLANSITISRLITLLLLIPLLVLDGSPYKLAALLVFTYIVFTDWLDGYLARKTKTVTALGAYLDPLVDKIVTTTALLVYAIKGLFWIWPLLTFIARDLAVNTIRARLKRQGTTMHASMTGKIKTTLQFALIYALILADASYGLELTIIALTAFAILFALISLAQYWKDAQTH